MLISYSHEKNTLYIFAIYFPFTIKLDKQSDKNVCYSKWCTFNVAKMRVKSKISGREFYFHVHQFEANGGVRFDEEKRSFRSLI